ncbi:hypothetical protein DEJ30_16085 [Curtobacterium sp. MCPF17_003]|nr:hypothetical protein DEJ30_16085 [Curtobacterium sp. MCPF17_003]
MPVVRGTFYRAVDPRFRDFAVAGSRSSGRYSSAHQPTLYRSSSVVGVRAAMIIQNDVRPEAVEIVAIDLEASGIVALRDVNALEAVGIDFEDALAPWQAIAESGGTPRSWTVRDRLIEGGAIGLVDPSRKSPGLWHLVLCRWNVAETHRESVCSMDTASAGEATFHVEHRSSPTEQAGHEVPVFHVEHRQPGSGAVVPDGLLSELGVGPAEVETGRGQRLREQ